MAAPQIIMPQPGSKPCVCGAALLVSRAPGHGRSSEVWRCSRHCGARGLTYAGALRRKIRLDLLSWGDLRRNAEALMNADAEELRVCLIQ